MQEKITENTLIIPTGFIFEFEEGFLTIGNNENIVIRGNIGKPVKKVFSENGDIYLICNREFEADTIESKRGKVMISGKLKVNVIRGTHIEFNKGVLKAKAIMGSNEINIDGDHIQADLLMAPKIVISQKTSGRATIVESQNEIPPNQLKGCFRISEFNEIFPNAGRILKEIENTMNVFKGETGLLDSTPVLAPEKPAEVDEIGVDEELHEESGEDIQEEMVVIPDISPSGSPESQFIEEEEEEEEEEKGAMEEKPGLKESAPSPPIEMESTGTSIRVLVPQHIVEKIVDAVEKIRDAYQKMEVPPSVNYLKTLIEEEKFDTLKKKIDLIWKDILTFHKEKGVFIPNVVTNMIKFIRSSLEGLNI